VISPSLTFGSPSSSANRMTARTDVARDRGHPHWGGRRTAALLQSGIFKASAAARASSCNHISDDDPSKFDLAARTPCHPAVEKWHGPDRIGARRSAGRRARAMPTGFAVPGARGRGLARAENINCTHQGLPVGSPSTVADT
jgi:hypothetical protein